MFFESTILCICSNFNLTLLTKFQIATNFFARNYSNYDEQMIHARMFFLQNLKKGGKRRKEQRQKGKIFRGKNSNLYMELNYRINRQIFQKDSMGFKSLIALALILSLVSSQDWSAGTSFPSFEGGRLEHLESNVIQLEQEASTNINFTKEYSYTLTEGVFSSTENFYIATGILDMEVPSTTRYYLQVTKAQISTSRDTFLLTVTNADSNGEIEYSKLLISFLIVGSDFPGYSPTMESSYIYAKNGYLQDVASAQESTFFDFKSSSGVSDSPFNYLPDGYYGQGCGAIKKGDNIIIEDQLCQHEQFYVYVTGFQFQSDTANDDIDISAVLIASSLPATDAAIGYTPYTKGSLPPIFKDSVSDAQVGLPIKYTDVTGLDTSGILLKLQLSFVFVGIRSYDAATYPSQSPLFTDSFLYFGFASDSTVADPTYQRITTDGAMSHAFCGISRFYRFGAAGAFNTAATYNFAVPNQITPNNFVTCVLFRVRDVCVDEIGTPVSTSPSDITIDHNFGEGNLELISDLGFADDGFSLTPEFRPTLKFLFLPQNENSVATITIQYNRPNVAAFQVKVVVKDSLGLGLLSGDSVFVSLFGEEAISFTPAASTSMSETQTIYSSDSSLQEAVISFSRTATTPSPVGTTLQISILPINKVIDGIKCSEFCTEKAGYDLGVDTASTPPLCLNCDTSKNLEFRDNSCECKTNYDYYDDGLCEKCSQLLCDRCTITDTTETCDQCVANAVGGAGVDCACIEGYYPSLTLPQCIKCNVACDTCTSANSCNTCKANEGTRAPASQGCVCLTGYFDNGDLVCEVCNPQCLTCQTTAATCTSCNTAGNFQAKGTTCVCKSGYYMLRTDTDVTCQPCDSSCKECDVSSLNCISCDEENKFRVLSGENTCECKEDFVDIGGDCLDTTCGNVDPNCQSCALDTATGSTLCLTCGDNRIVENEKCVCKVGFYESTAGTCAACGAGCQVCIDNTVCLSCAAKSFNNGDGSCVCPSGTVLVEAVGSLYCRPCSSECLDCRGSFDFCTSCSNEYIYEEATGKCLCPKGTYKSVNSQCLPCMANCEECENAQVCDKCAPSYVWNQTSCSLSCPIGQFIEDESCKSCGQGCDVCLNGFTCTNCSSGYLMYVGSCRKECPEGTFPFNSEQCFSCLSPCKTCSGTGDNCDSCLRGFVYFNHECKTDCDPGTFFADGSCLVCSSRCATCSGSSSSCTSCASGQYLYKDSCYTECPAAVVNGKCTDICPDGQYLDGNVCKDCASKCETCRNSATNCTRCADGYKSYDGECLQLCPANTLDSGSFCLRCDPTCNGCESSIYNCVNCAQGLVKLNGQCVEGCPEGSFLNYATGSCEFCGTGCKMCHSATRCTDCFDATETPINGACQKTCPVGANLVNGECVCFFGVSHLGACVSSCPEGYFAINGKCVACKSPCKDCVGSDSNCLSCREGFELDIQSRKCEKSNACPYGQALDGTCKRICGNGLFFHKTACIFICPIGYVDNGYGGCIQETSPSFCQPPQFQQGTSCRDSCLLGHYPNHFTRVCEKCPAGCLLCISAETCLQCNVGKILISGHCEDSIGCQPSQVQYKGRCEARCPVGTARDGNTCQAACEEKTYFYDGVCYQTCPTGHHTPEACVNDCANYDRCE